MKVSSIIDTPQMKNLIDTIRMDANAWTCLTVTAKEYNTPDLLHIAHKISTALSNQEGHIFVCNDTEILTLIQTSDDKEWSEIKGQLTLALSQSPCTITTTSIPRDQIDSIESKLLESAANELGGTFFKDNLSTLRNNREDKVFFVVDDDALPRSLVSAALRQFGSVVQLDDGKKLIAQYLAQAPDVVFLDIHMPGKSGLELLFEILSYDPDASIVIVSSDNVKNNVLFSRQGGAKGFITKPFTKGMIESAMKGCFIQQREN